MRTQEHNKGDLKELKVCIEKNVVETVERMSSHTNISIDELVVIALKRFCASHSDYDNKTPIQG